VGGAYRDNFYRDRFQNGGKRKTRVPSGWAHVVHTKGKRPVKLFHVSTLESKKGTHFQGLTRKRIVQENCQGRLTNVSNKPVTREEGVAYHRTSHNEQARTTEGGFRAQLDIISPVQKMAQELRTTPTKKKNRHQFGPAGMPSITWSKKKKRDGRGKRE